MKTLVLFLDAFRFKDLNKENAPFIYSLAQNGLYSNLITIPGYHVEYSILSGSYPLKHNVWIWFYLNKEKSPFKWIKKYNFFFKILDKTFLRNCLRTYITYISSFKRYLQGKTRVLKINQIPLEEAPDYSILVDKSYIDKNSMNVPTVFDLLRINNKNYLASEWPVLSTNKETWFQYSKGSDKEKFNLLKQNVKNYELLYCHFWQLDSLTHKYGINSFEVKTHLNNLDRYVRDLYLEAKKYGDVNILIFSDHGMTKITKIINIKKELEKIGIKDYKIFLGSTTAHLWLRDKSLISLIKKKLTKEIEIYDKDNIEKLNIPYKRECVGDLLLTVKPGYQISPNYFQRNEIAKAMHGYTLKNPDLDGIFILNGPKIKKKKLRNVKLLSVAPTILSLMSIKIPKTVDEPAIR